MKSALLALLLASSPDGGVEQLYVSCPDAPLAVAVDGGVFLPAPRAERIACRLAACESFAAGRLEEPEPQTSGVVLLVAVGVVLLGGGIYLGWRLRPQQ